LQIGTDTGKDGNGDDLALPRQVTIGLPRECQRLGRTFQGVSVTSPGHVAGSELVAKAVIDHTHVLGGHLFVVPRDTFWSAMKIFRDSPAYRRGPPCDLR